MENSVSILITLEGEKEEIKSLHAKTKAWTSKKWLNIPSVEILDVNPISEEKRLEEGQYSFEIYYQTNRKEHSKMWEELLKKKTPSVRMYYLKEEGVLFSGDTVFQGSVGRTDFPEGSTAAIVRSLHRLLDTLPDETEVYPGHDASTTIGYEKRYNPFV